VQTSAPRLRGTRGLVHFRMRSIRFKDGRQAPGQVLHRIREGDEPPPYGAEAWKAADGKWGYDFGGQWFEKGDGKLEWRWP
jgi:hypothetical protein